MAAVAMFVTLCGCGGNKFSLSKPNRDVRLGTGEYRRVSHVFFLKVNPDDRKVTVSFGDSKFWYTLNRYVSVQFSPNWSQTSRGEVAVTVTYNLPSGVLEGNSYIINISAKAERDGDIDQAIYTYDASSDSTERQDARAANDHSAFAPIMTLQRDESGAWSSHVSEVTP
jgi:hypothetical protein